MIRVIFIVVSLLLLVAAVVGGLYYWGVDPLAKLGLVNPPVESGSPPPAPPSPPAYVDFGLLMVPVIALSITCGVLSLRYLRNDSRTRSKMITDSLTE